MSSISEKIGRLTATSSLEFKPHLRRNNCIKSIHSSLKIEANSLSLGQVRDVIGGKTVLGKQTEIQEVKNAYEAYEHLSEIDKILYDIPAQIKEENHLLSDYVQKLLSVMEYDIPYTSTALMEKLDLKSKETFRKNYLHPAIKLDLIRMTIPDKPRSRNQRYIKL